ncbi:MAG: helix-turn-helix domain-containing protein [Nanoarchaeota archaeon]
MTNKFIMVSLEEKKAKKIAEVLSNDTARKILDYLADKNEATVSEISDDLEIAISTVDYNIKNLIDSGLVISKEFKWSSKGRQMDIYKLARKYIIISPGKYSEFKETLKRILPIGVIGIGVGIYIELKNKASFLVSDTKEIITKVEPVVEKAVDEAVSAGVSSLEAPVAQQEVLNKTIEVIPRIIEQATHNGYYFIIGVVFAIVLYLIFSWRRK